MNTLAIINIVLDVVVVTMFYVGDMLNRRTSGEGIAAPILIIFYLTLALNIFFALWYLVFIG